ncbi:hypothetical protein CDAR_381681 [Caerostris darwini]|uniref:Uncharacterized protein n=1 Tax=Caerostris darwini TaxID=1538125 RepID=A0AAV4V6T0_9ARAC|nr:hypothetical protein CDAR_381681 [Caerostris darwini]
MQGPFPSRLQNLDHGINHYYTSNHDISPFRPAAFPRFILLSACLSRETLQTYNISRKESVCPSRGSYKRELIKTPFITLEHTSREGRGKATVG